MSKRKHKLIGLITVFSGRARVANSKPLQLPLTRPLSLNEITLLWDVERALNSLPVEVGTHVRLDVVPRLG